MHSWLKSSIESCEMTYISGCERWLLVTLSQAIYTGTTQLTVQQESVCSKHCRRCHLVYSTVLHSIRNVLQCSARRRTGHIWPSSVGYSHLGICYFRRDVAGEKLYFMLKLLRDMLVRHLTWTLISWLSSIWGSVMYYWLSYFFIICRLDAVN